jgi:hypothetical protein
MNTKRVLFAVFTRSVNVYTTVIFLVFFLSVFALAEKRVLKVISEEASIHLWPDAKSKVIGQIPSGTYLYSEYIDGVWFRVNFRSHKDAIMKSGFIHQDDVENIQAKKRNQPQIYIAGKRALIEEDMRYKGDLVSLKFRDADIRDVIAVLCEVGGWSVVFDSGVKGKISCELVDVPWDQALDVILSSQRLGKVSDGKVFRIGRIKDLIERN